MTGHARNFQEASVVLPTSNLLGDWWGELPRWQDQGFTPQLIWVTNLAGNPFGGRTQGFTECENLGLDMVFDLEKLEGIRDTNFHVSLSRRSGTSLTKDYIGNVFNTQQVFGGETFKLANFNIQHYCCDHKVDVALGRIAVGDDFLVSPFYGFFMSSGVDGNPDAIFINAPGTTQYPGDTWGARMRVATSERTYAMLGLYNGDANIQGNQFHGCDFSLHGPLFAIAEVGYTRNGHEDDPGKLGHYKLGGYYDGGSYQTFSPSQFVPGGIGPSPGMVSGNWGYYALFDQVIYQPHGKDDPRGMGVFATLIVAPDTSINQIPFFCDGGVLYRGLIPGRPTDTIGFSATYGKFSPDLQAAQETAQALDPIVGAQEYELVFETAYRIRMRKGAVFVEPDLQYIVNPGGAHQYPNALVVGAQAGINF